MNNPHAQTRSPHHRNMKHARRKSSPNAIRGLLCRRMCAAHVLHDNDDDGDDDDAAAVANAAATAATAVVVVVDVVVVAQAKHTHPIQKAGERN